MVCCLPPGASRVPTTRFDIPPALGQQLLAKAPAHLEMPTRDAYRQTVFAPHTPTAPAALRPSATRPVGYVVGGAPVPLADVPGPLVRIVGSGEELGFCSGTVIARFLVLTAAHCADYAAELGSVSVIAGTRVLGGSGTAVRYDVVGMVTDPQWDEANRTHDAAVLVLSKPFAGTPVTLATSDSTVPNGTALHLYGWGLTATGASPLRLQHATLHAITNDACADLVAPLFDPPVDEPVRDAMLCTHDPAAGGCHGDSGGPLFQGTGANRVQVGIVSWGSPDCDPSYASVFARVAALHAFLDPLLARAPFAIDVTVPWVDWAAFTYGQGDKPTDVCAISLAWATSACTGDTLIFVHGRTAWALTALRGAVLVSFVPLDRDMDQLAAPTAANAMVSAASLGRVAVAPKPTAAILKLAADSVYPATALSDGSTTCTLLMAFQLEDCQGAGTLTPLAFPYIASLTSVPGLATSGLAFGDDLVSTPTTVLQGPFKTGMVSSIAPHFALPAATTLLAPKLGKGILTDITVWPHGASDPVGGCTLIASHVPFALCGGSAAGLLGGKFLVPSSSGPIDLEALQYATMEDGSPTGAAVVENLATPPGTVAVPFMFGSPAKAA